VRVDTDPYSGATLAEMVMANQGDLDEVRVRIRSRSNSASPPSTVSINRPCDVVVSAHVDALQNAESQLPEEVRTKFLADFDKDFKGTMRVVVAGMVHEKTDAELTEWLVTRASAQDPKMALALMRDLFGLDTVAAFKEAKVPVRCINSFCGVSASTCCGGWFAVSPRLHQGRRWELSGTPRNRRPSHAW
jgi:hypothetical protein